MERPPRDPLSTRCGASASVWLALLLAPGGCAPHTGAPPNAAQRLPVVAAPPPRDDGGSSELGAGGAAHSAALEQLRSAPLRMVADRQRSVRFALPDAEHWTRVKFFGIPTVMGLRYGKDHHAVVGVTVQRVGPDAPLAACATAFEAWGAPLLDVFDVDVKRAEPRTVAWRARAGEPPREAEVHESFARAESLAVKDGFAVAYATYPAWKGGCLIVGVAVPARDDEPRALEVRDRFVREVLPSVVLLSNDEPAGRE